MRQLELLNNYLRDLYIVYVCSFAMHVTLYIARSQIKYVRLNSCIYISNLNDFNHNDFAMNLFVITYNEGNGGNNVCIVSIHTHNTDGIVRTG